MRNLSVFLDVSTLEAGPFTNNLLDNIRGAHSFVLVLTEAALDRCFGDLDQRDWIHKEVRSDTVFYFFQYALFLHFLFDNEYVIRISQL